MSDSLLGLSAPDVAADPSFVELLEVALDDDEEAPARRIRRPDPRPDDARDVAHLAAAFLAVEPLAVRRHRRLGLSAEVTAATLADVGRKIDAYGASADLSWLVGLARADVIALGRLQFERWASPEGRALHIPEGGPLDPRAVDDSLRQARELFGDGPIVCHTWLFDPALRALPAESNIVAFASRFEVLGSVDEHAAASSDTTAATATASSFSAAASSATSAATATAAAASSATAVAAAASSATAAAYAAAAGQDLAHPSDPVAADHAVAKFVFRRPLADVLDPARVQPRTAVERIVASRLRSGAHWSEPRGILIR
ncbi:acyltransferase domain-containing protein [Herbiconiux sp. P17]|uniref:acyltransferase domain-containing protein n=1 Tax=Herbiconiux wuyangfengii TaxID=3342794 RepID=UPI0035B80891